MRHPLRSVFAAALPSLLVACMAGSESGDGAMTAVERGRYLATIGGCNDCHTPKIPGPDFAFDSSRLLSGHPSADTVLPAVPRGLIGPAGWAAVANGHFTAWVGPWGTSFAANLTPHATGLESWTDSLFIVTMRTGRHLGVGRQILPPMPWPSLAAMTDDDLRSLFAYLQSLPPVDNRVPPPRQ